MASQVKTPKLQLKAADNFHCLAATNIAIVLCVLLASKLPWYQPRYRLANVLNAFGDTLQQDSKSLYLMLAFRV